MYMGVNLESSDTTLPISRWIVGMKLRAIKRRAGKRGIADPAFLTTHHMEHRKDKRSFLGAWARLTYRLADAYYRQLVSLFHQLRGYTVVYDRHFVIDCAPGPNDRKRLPDRIHYWFLTRLYPQPRWVIMLDAEAEVLYARKQEVPVEYLRAKREALLELGTRMERFVVVDAAQPVDRVFDRVAELIWGWVEPVER
jgi:hypothetical protein